MEEFNATIQLHRRLTADDSQSNEILANLANAVDDHDRFSDHTTTGVRFWRNIYNLLLTVDPTNKLLWSSVAVVEQAIKQPSMRSFLVNIMDYVPLMAELVLRCNKCTPPQAQQLLHILDSMCVDYRRAGDQPVFYAIVRHLLKLLHAQQHDRQLAALSLSALISLCDRNATVLQHLRHQVRLSELATELNGFVVLGARMQFVLARTSGESREQIDAHLPNLVQLVQKQMVEAVRVKDQQTLTHLTRFIDDICRHRSKVRADGQPIVDEALHSLMPDLSAAFAHVLDAVEKTIAAKAGADQFNLLHSLIRMCIAVVQLAGAALANQFNRLTNLTLSLFELDGTARQSQSLAGTAFDTIRTMMLHLPSVASIFCDKLIALIRNRLAGLSAVSVDCGQFVPLFQLLDTCVDKVPATAVDLIAPDTFAALWQPLTERKINPFQVSTGMLRMYVQSLSLLLRCSDLEPGDGQRTEVLRQLLTKTPVHYVLALANNSPDPAMQRLVFRLAHSSHFPTDAIAEISSAMRRRTSDDLSASRHSDYLATGGVHTMSPRPSTCCTLAAPNTARLQQLMDNIQTTIEQRGGAAHLSSTHIIDLYRHKLRDTELREQQLQHSHETTLRTVVELQHALAQQARELSAYDATVYAAVAAEEVLRSELEQLQRDSANLSKASQDLNAHLDRVVERGELERREAGQRLQIAEVEIQNFKKQIDTERQKAQADEKRRLRDMKEQQKLNEVLKQSIAKYETRVVEFEERVRQSTEELAAEKVRCRSAVAVKESALKQLESQLAEKQTQLLRVTAENEENIKLRNSIMQMIQGKSSTL